MANTFIFICPFCGRRLECDDSLENKAVPCPACESNIVPRKNPLAGKIRVVGDPIPQSPNAKVANPADPSQKKDLLFIWIVYPIFNFNYILLCGAANTWNGVLVVAAIGFFLLSLIVASVTIEIGKEDKRKLAFIIFLLWVLFPIGFIMYAEERKERGLSNITPWAVIASIVNGLTLIITIWFVFNR